MFSWIPLLPVGVQYSIIGLLALISVLMFGALCIVVFNHVRIKFKDTVIEAPVESVEETKPETKEG